MSSTVTVHVYDLSQGYAQQLSKAVVGKEFKAVYHTGVVVYGTEYFYGAGIDTGFPGATPYGVPIKKVDNGTTTKTLQEIQTWIKEQN